MGCGASQASKEEVTAADIENRKSKIAEINKKSGTDLFHKVCEHICVTVIPGIGVHHYVMCSYVYCTVCLCVWHMPISVCLSIRT